MSAEPAFLHELTAESRATPVRVLLADRAGPARRALATLVDGLAGAELSGVAGDLEGVAHILRHDPADVLVIDDRLLGGDEHVLADLRAAGATRLRAVVVGVDDDPAFAARARRLGAEAWIAKDDADERLPELLAR